jgi:signal transduction histidine kinase
VSLRVQLSIVVGAAALGLILVMASTALIGMRETRELEAVQGRLLPRLALGPRLESDFERLGRTMQDAVAAQDRDALEQQAPAIRDAMFQRIAAAPGALSVQQAAAIRQRTNEYYDAARDVSRRLIDQETGEPMVEAMAAMQAKRAAAADAVTQATSLDYAQVAEHFAAIHAARATASRLRISVTAACLALVLFLSIKLSRDALSTIVRLSHGFSRFGRGDFTTPIPVTTKDEIGRLSVEANQMAERLRTTLDHLARTSADLTRANEELQAFSYSVAHDLRAPLRGIHGFSQALLEDYSAKLDEQGQHYLRRVGAAAQHMSQLIDGLLSLARITRGDLRAESVDVTALARAAAERLKAAQPERNVDFAIAEGLTATGDGRLLSVVLDNLLGNAWKFTRDAPRALIEVGCASRDGQPVFHVRDNGAGFDMAFASKLFGVFQRLHRSEEFEGTGIGLATVQRIIRRHAGRIWAEGRVGDGATFYFTLNETGTPA